MRQNIVILTGAGISAESGIKTFRDSDGLWENYPVEEVATLDAYRRNPELVLRFYNERRRQLRMAKPNEGHRQLVRLAAYHNVHIVTQNIDNLHEQAGSTQVLHLHGELTKARSDRDENLIVDIGYNDIHLGDKAPDGNQLRPHIVWFGEAVPKIEQAIELCRQADYFIVIGTSMNVYPAAGLIHYVPESTSCYIVDPKSVPIKRPMRIIAENAGTGVKKVVDEILNTKS